MENCLNGLRILIKRQNRIEFHKRSFLVLLNITLSLLIVEGQKFSNPIGWVTLNEGITGGAGGDTVVVNCRKEFLDILKYSTPLVICFKDTIDLKKGERVKLFNNNLSIIGSGEHAMIRYGGLNIYGNNIIIQNLSIGGSYVEGKWEGKDFPHTDALTLYGRNIWIDHCDLFQSYDGLLDISSTNSSCANYITVSWTHFSNHNKVMLIGSSNKNVNCRNNLNVTIHHCWFDGSSQFYDSVDNKYYRIQQRMPRVRFGKVHVFNNYYENAADYCIAARLESKVIAENNYFRNLSDAHIIRDIGKGVCDPELLAIGNIYDNVKGAFDTSGDAFRPDTLYSYPLDPSSEVPVLVMNNAGKFNRDTNADPIALNDTVHYSIEDMVLIYPLINDYDKDNDSVRICSVTDNPNLKIEIFSDHLKLYPDSNHNHPESVEYSIIDFQGGVSSAYIYFFKK
ncbi:MAG: hypothetical protein JW894_10120 [Bacteroidales bacterium]|nr:hypothetical protein [Bacteroidales bacterium]